MKTQQTERDRSMKRQNKPAVSLNARRDRARLVALMAALVGSVSWTARGDISFVNAFRNVSFLQTGDGNTLAPNGAFYSAELDSTLANNYSSVQMTYPGPGSPVNLPQTGPTVYHFQTPGLADQAAMDAAFPFGAYQFAASGGSPATTSFSYTADDYAASHPYLTGTDYSRLQGMNSSQPFTFHFSPDITGGMANSSFIFLTIFDFNKNAFVFDAGFLPATTTTETVPAGTLAPGDHFAYEVDFSNRDLVPSPGANFEAQLGFDLRTSGLFTSAVPDGGSSWMLFAGALAAMGALARKLLSSQV